MKNEEAFVWNDGGPDSNRHMARNSRYAEWYVTKWRIE